MSEERLPLVSCIMPTYNRRAFVPHAIRYFLAQDYAHKELIVIDDGSDPVEDLVPVSDTIRYYRLDQKITLGAKLNLACKYARGSIIANWDDDDWYASRRLSYQVAALQQPEIAVCGINRLLYYDLRHRHGFQYIYPDGHRIWLLGSSLCFTKELWRANAFADINVGMDGLFVWATPPERVKALEDPTFAVHMIHDHNVSPKKTDSGWWYPHPVEALERIVGADWHYYTNGLAGPAPVRVEADAPALKNVFACLVHEQEDCIIDLVRNLHYFDPASIILIYNGSDNRDLIASRFPYERYGVVFHPHPRPQQHGYLHTFALDCMAFAVENLAFDVMTIVDSDQLCIRPDYSKHISAYLAGSSRVGMLSSKPERITPDNRSNRVALQFFDEYALWAPLLSQLPGGDGQAAYWTFWPSSVFTVEAIRALLQLFDESDLLRQIMQQTRIWATEEVIFPILVKRLGFEIAANPCNYDFVRYKHTYSLPDIEGALRRHDAFWVHPIQRQYENPLRKFIRQQFRHYSPAGDTQSSLKSSPSPMFQTLRLIERIRHIEGWLSDAEADLLIAATLKACIELPPPQAIVEIGSYHGKSTVLLGTVARTYFPQATVHAIDPHEGVVGAVDQQLEALPPSLNSFRQNMSREGLTEVIEVIQNYSFNVHWERPIAFLFIDGLHDYPNVARDFWHFAGWIGVGGYVAFHDYAHYYPGVQAFVEELLTTDNYRKVEQADSLIVLQKIS
jgi:glycosyltransferase involved in cell wall biosynthesis